MAITHTQTVSKLNILNNSDNIVSEVTVHRLSTDDSDPEKFKVESDTSFRLDTSGGTGASGFVAYESLTQSTILAWDTVKDGITTWNIQANHEEWIERQIALEQTTTPTEINKALPW